MEYVPVAVPLNAHASIVQVYDGVYNMSTGVHVCCMQA